MANTLKINRGATFTMDFNYQKNGVAETLVGATVYFTMKTSEYDTSASDTTAVIKKDITDGDADGQATIIIDPADTINLTPGDYFFDIFVEEASGARYKTVEGKIKLDASPTNRGV